MYVWPLGENPTLSKMLKIMSEIFMLDSSLLKRLNLHQDSRLNYHCLIIIANIALRLQISHKPHVKRMKIFLLQGMLGMPLILWFSPVVKLKR